MSRARACSPEREPVAIRRGSRRSPTCRSSTGSTGRKAVVAGGSDGALWKAELLAAAGADVLVLAGEGGAEKFEALAARSTVLPRGWTPADLEGAALAVADPGGRDEALRFVAAARAAGVPVNVIDQTDLCDVQFGTIVNRSPVVLAISTGGARADARPVDPGPDRERCFRSASRPGRRRRRRWRPRLKARVKSFARPPRLLGALRRARLGRRRTPDGGRRRLFEPPARAREGRVTLVGAGPGDPELLTLKAVRALQSATVILYDDLVGPDDTRARPARGEAGRGRQDRPRPLLPPVRHQRADGRARPRRRDRRPAEGRRSADLRPGHRGDRGLPGRRDRGRRSSPASPPRRAPPPRSASR